MSRVCEQQNDIYSIVYIFQSLYDTLSSFKRFGIVICPNFLNSNYYNLLKRETCICRTIVTINHNIKVDVAMHFLHQAVAADCVATYCAYRMHMPAEQVQNCRKASTMLTLFPLG